LFDLFAQGVLANSTTGKQATEKEYLNFQMVSINDQSYIHTTNFGVHNYLIFPAVKYS
jgi:hypothetical protein